MTSLLQKAAAIPRGPLLALLIVLVLGQLIAFWMLCDQQVHRAEARRAVAQAERTAIHAAQNAAQPWDAAAVEHATLNTAAPVALAFR